MIYNPACAHCRQKLKQGLRNSYSDRSAMIKNRERSISSGALPSQQPWLNERVLRAFDEPPPSQALPDYNLCPPMGSFCSSPIQSAPNAAFEEMLQPLENAIEASQLEAAQARNMHAGERIGHDILSPIARAQLQLVGEMEDPYMSYPEAWWTSPSAPVPMPHSSAISDYSLSPSPAAPALSAPSFSNPGIEPPIDPCYNPSPSFHDQLFDMLDDYMPDSFLSGQSPPFSMPNYKQSGHMRRHRNTPKRQPARKFEFILENVGGQ